MNEDTTKPQLSTPGRYLSLVVYLWVSEDGKLLRGTLEDATLESGWQSTFLPLQHCSRKVWQMRKMRKK